MLYSSDEDQNNPIKNATRGNLNWKELLFSLPGKVELGGTKIVLSRNETSVRPHKRFSVRVK